MAMASPFTLTYSGVGSGSLAGVPFLNAPFTLTEVVDTVNRVPILNGYAIQDTSASILIGGVGDYGFLTSTFAFVNNSTMLAGFSRGADLIYAPFDAPFLPAYAAWDLATPLGPFTGTGQLLQWALPSVQTTGGVLVFANATPTITFQATAGAPVPEPSSFGATFILLALVRTRFRRLGSSPWPLLNKHVGPN